MQLYTIPPPQNLAACHGLLRTVLLLLMCCSAAAQYAPPPLRPCLPAFRLLEKVEQRVRQQLGPAYPLLMLGQTAVLVMAAAHLVLRQARKLHGRRLAGWGSASKLN